MTQIRYGEHVGHAPTEGPVLPRAEDLTPPLASLTNVSVQYEAAAATALARVTLCVEPGEVVGLLGANGAGKSTLLRVVAGLTTPSEGSAQIRTRRIDTMPRRERARLVAFVPQNEAIAEGFRVRDVVAMGRAAHQNLWMQESVSDARAIDEALARCDLTRHAHKRVETLSGGEQRRVALARALAQRPQLLLLDEPAAFLDVRHRLELHALLRTLAEEDRVASICTLHDLDTAARFPTRVILLQAGRIIADGSPDDVMTAERLAPVLGVEVGIGVHAPSGARYFLPLSVARQASDR